MPKSQLITIFIAIIALVGLDYIHAAWTAPSSNPPKGNIAVPLNTGNNSQTKSGALGAGALSITGESQFNGKVKFVDDGLEMDVRNEAYGGMSKWVVRSDDGMAHFSSYINTTGGQQATRLTRGRAFRESFYIPWGVYSFWGTTNAAAKGTSIDWKEVFRIYPDGRVGADKYCNLNGGSCIVPGSVGGDFTVEGPYKWKVGAWGSCYGAKPRSCTYGISRYDYAYGMRGRTVECISTSQNIVVHPKFCTDTKPDVMGQCTIRIPVCNTEGGYGSY